MGEHPHPFVPTRIQTCGGDSGFRLRMCLLRGPRLVGVSVDEVEFQAGMLHHHYPCLAEMAGTRTSATRSEGAGSRAGEAVPAGGLH